MGEATSGNLLWAMVTVILGLIWALREFTRYVTAKKRNGQCDDNTLSALARVNVTPRDIANHYERQSEMVDIMRENTQILKQLASNSTAQTRLMERMEARLEVRDSRI